jgi:ABC-type branched-subunit amino acid transport system substrate-binding protein
VAQYLNTSKVPDLFVASGCVCWNNPKQHPYTFGYQPDYVIEGQIQGQYVKQNEAGKKIGYFFQNDDFGRDGVKGLDMQIPASQVLSRQSYDVTNLDVGPQISALQAKGAQVVVSYSVPAFTALALLAAAKIGYHPTWVVSDVGDDVVTLAGLLSQFSKGAAGASLLNGMISDAYLPPYGDTSNPWIQLFKRIHDQYIPKLPFDFNVEYGLGAAYTFVQAMVAAGRNPTRDDVVHAIETSHFSGPGLVPFAYSATDHDGYAGAQMGTVQNGVLVLTGTPYTATDAGNVQPYTASPPLPPADGVPS